MLFALLALAGAAGASVNSASGRAVLHWFGPDERGLALGVRQTAIPLGAGVAALVLPPLVAAGGLDAAFAFLGGVCIAGAAAGGVVIRDRPTHEPLQPSAPSALRDRRIWGPRLGSSLYLVPQIAVTGFVVLFLHDVRGLSPAEAAAVLAAIQLAAVALRIASGRWSDVLGDRLVPLRRTGLAIAAAVALTTALTSAPLELLVPSFVAAGGLSMAWNGLAFTAAAELAGLGRSGAAIGLQQTILALVGTLVAPAFAATVDATSWRTGFALAALAPLGGWWALRALTGAVETRAVG